MNATPQHPDPSFVLDAIAETAEAIASVAAEAREADAAREQLEAAQAALLERVIASVRPALRALGTRPLVAQHVAHHADVNHNGGVRTEERYPSRCVCISEGEPGPMEDTPRANEGTYHGEDLFIREDGTLIGLTYSGSWSRWQGSSWGWTAEITEYVSPLEAIAAGWARVDAYVRNLAAAVVKAEGSRKNAIAANRARAEQLTAIVALLAANGKKGGRS
jgi:hypothetical protein